jgi:hypothetical protein
MEPDIFDIPESQPEPDASPRLADMTPGEMDALRTHLGLGLPLPRLMALASLYQKEKHQPADRELKLLDSLLYPLIMQPHNALLAALQTSDAPAAEALASMIEHSRAPGGITPQPTPKSALDALGHAQVSADILPPPPDHASGMRLSLSHLADLPILSRHGLAPVDDLAIQGTPWHVISAAPVPSVTDKQTRTGDLYSLISPPSHEDAQSTLSRLLTAPDVAHRLCFVRYVEEGDYSDGKVELKVTANAIQLQGWSDAPYCGYNLCVRTNAFNMTQEGDYFFEVGDPDRRMLTTPGLTIRLRRM